ncbi:hypothetical protein G5714_014549 [Onychostoma macrolepis]|uniref:non-specific serine/threonine protein kinase n=1 Tax=Onychostoma macrolepis TaxID=369639 RepID=A0A7J6CD45_9TELE|nr:hypothetical protein G5714_014549 [Onychostoma macrolepis]
MNGAEAFYRVHYGTVNIPRRDNTDTHRPHGGAPSSPDQTPVDIGEEREDTTPRRRGRKRAGLPLYSVVSLPTNPAKLRRTKIIRSLLPVLLKTPRCRGVQPQDQDSPVSPSADESFTSETPDEITRSEDLICWMYAIGEKLEEGCSVFAGTRREDGLPPDHPSPVPLEVALTVMANQDPRCHHIIELLDCRSIPTSTSWSQSGPCPEWTRTISGGIRASSSVRHWCFISCGKRLTLLSLAVPGGLPSGHQDFQAPDQHRDRAECCCFIPGCLKSDPEQRVHLEETLSHDWFKVL